MQTLLDRALECDKERKAIFADVRKMVDNSLFTAKCHVVDDTFVRKILHYPGDITTARIIKVLKKVAAIKSDEIYTLYLDKQEYYLTKEDAEKARAKAIEGIQAKIKWDVEYYKNGPESDLPHVTWKYAMLKQYQENPVKLLNFPSA